METVDGGDVGEDPCNDILMDSSLSELSAKYLQRERERQRKRMYTKTLSKHSPTLALIHAAGMYTQAEKFPCCCLPYKHCPTAGCEAS